MPVSNGKLQCCDPTGRQIVSTVSCQKVDQIGPTRIVTHQHDLLVLITQVSQQMDQLEWGGAVYLFFYQDFRVRKTQFSCDQCCSTLGSGCRASDYQTGVRRSALSPFAHFRRILLTALI